MAKTFTWEACTDPKWRGKTAMNDQSQHLSRLFLDDAWGRVKTLDYAKRGAENKPIMNASLSDGAEKVNTGAYYMLCGMARGQVKDIQTNSGSKSIGIVYPEPVPARVGDIIYVPDKARHPNAGILFLAWIGTPEAQKLLDATDYTGHTLVEGSESKADLKGKKVAPPTWNDTESADAHRAEIFQAMGMPVVR